MMGTTHGITGIESGAVYEQVFTRYRTIFHGEPAPEDDSRLPDV